MSLNVRVDNWIETFIKDTRVQEEVVFLKAAKKAISNWSALNNDCCFANFFYRIGQAILSIFGQSDWQIARNAISKYTIKALDAVLGEIPLIKISTPADFQKTIYKTVDKCLEILLKINNRNFLENQNPIEDLQFCAEIINDMVPTGIDFVKSGITCASKAMPPSLIGALAREKLSQGFIQQFIDSFVSDFRLKEVRKETTLLTTAIGTHLDPIVNALAPSIKAFEIDAKDITKTTSKYLKDQHNIVFKS